MRTKSLISIDKSTYFGYEITDSGKGKGVIEYA